MLTLWLPRRESSRTGVVWPGLPSFLKGKGGETRQEGDPWAGMGCHSLGLGEAFPCDDAGERRGVQNVGAAAGR